MPGISLIRFIPTPVGNIDHADSIKHFKTVHPHACGEHFIRQNNEGTLSGSSPRLWGTSILLLFQYQYRRFIPTPVGNIHRLPVYARQPPVHPHACGEHELVISAKDCRVGSSPRLWGTYFTQPTKTANNFQHPIIYQLFPFISV